MGTSQIAKDVATAINKCWPYGVVEEFSTDESYFHEVHARLERDLRNIRGASLRWQTEEEDSGARWDDDWEDEPAFSDEWQSYHVFFLAPEDKEFHFEDETDVIAEAEDPEEEEWTETTYLGEGWIGCAVGICLAAPFAVIDLCRYSQYEDGSISIPDVESFIFSDETNERVDTDQHYRELLSEKAFQQLEELRDKIAAILVKHRLQVLDKSVLDLRVPDLTASEEVFLEEPLSVRDALFFRGV